MRCDLTALTVQELDDLERSLGSSVGEIIKRGSAVQVRDLAVALLSRDMTPDEAQAAAGSLKPGELIFDLDGADDLPAMYDDYLPDEGGWTADRFVCFFAGPPWCWPPDVTLASGCVICVCCRTPSVDGSPTDDE